jgi:hypothetical protein
LTEQKKKLDPGNPFGPSEKPARGPGSLHRNGIFSSRWLVGPTTPHHRLLLSLDGIHAQDFRVQWILSAFNPNDSLPKSTHPCGYKKPYSSSPIPLLFPRQQCHQAAEFARRTSAFLRPTELDSDDNGEPETLSPLLTSLVFYGATPWPFSLASITTDRHAWRSPKATAAPLCSSRFPLLPLEAIEGAVHILETVTPRWRPSHLCRRPEPDRTPPELNPSRHARLSSPEP